MIKADDPMLDLKVKIININPSAWHEILEKCEVIRQYSEFIETIRKYQTGGDTGSYYHAILECMNKGVLTEYLRRKGSEVVNFLQAEYDYEMDVEVQREEAREEGREETLYDVLFNVLEMKGTISEDMKENINHEHDPEVLNRWILLAVQADTIQNFEESMMRTNNLRIHRKFSKLTGVFLVLYL